MDELYVLARRVLLDALEALGDHRDAVVLVGAQAVYLRVGEADLAVAPFTTDGDPAIDPAVLAEVPPLEQALLEAGFFPKTKDSVGMWITHHPTSHSPKTEVRADEPGVMDSFRSATREDDSHSARLRNKSTSNQSTSLRAAIIAL